MAKIITVYCDRERDIWSRWGGGGGDLGGWRGNCLSEALSANLRGLWVWWQESNPEKAMVTLWMASCTKSRRLNSNIKVKEGKRITFAS